MSRLKEILRGPYKAFVLFFKINWYKTFLINLRTQDFKIAIQLPIVVFGKLKIYSLSGEITINSPIRFGMVQLGRDIDQTAFSSLPVKFNVPEGELIFNGPVIISGGTNITVWRGKIEIGKYVVIGSGCNIKAFERITIGDYTRFSANTFVMDTNVHFIKNTVSQKIAKIYGPITIGKYCWINMGTSISKNTILPDYTIVGRNSFLNKDYTTKNEKQMFLVGNPAKIKSENLQRIFGIKLERELLTTFMCNSDLSEIHHDAVVDEKEEDFIFFFNIFNF